MLNQRKWLLLFAMLFLGLAAKVITPENFVRTASAEALETEQEEERLEVLTTEDIWKQVYRELMVETEVSTEWIATLALAEIRDRDLELMSSTTDHIVNYHGKRYAITDDEYQVLLKIVEAEAGGEDIKGKMLVANVVLNRVEEGLGGDTISEVVFAKGQFSPVSSGKFFRVKPSEETIEAVERVLNGEDESQGALYFMSRKYASKKGSNWFDNNLQFLFWHGGHEFFKEK